MIIGKPIIVHSEIVCDFFHLKTNAIRIRLCFALSKQLPHFVYCLLFEILFFYFSILAYGTLFLIISNEQETSTDINI